MDFILSKIINRPQRIDLLADDEPMSDIYVDIESDQMPVTDDEDVLLFENNKALPIEGPVNRPRDDLDDSYIKDPRTLNTTVGQDDLENSYFVAPIAVRQTPAKRASAINETCDDILGNFHSLGLATPQHKRALAANKPSEGSNNALSSDEETFQECENTFDGAATKTVLAESGFRSIYIDESMSNTINFSAHAANSTLARTLSDIKCDVSIGNPTPDGTAVTRESPLPNLDDTVEATNATFNGTMNSTANFVLALERDENVFVNEADLNESVVAVGGDKTIEANPCESQSIDEGLATDKLSEVDKSPAEATENHAKNPEDVAINSADVISTASDCTFAGTMEIPPVADNTDLNVTETVTPLACETIETEKSESTNEVASIAIALDGTQTIEPSDDLTGYTSDSIALQKIEDEFQQMLNGTRVINPPNGNELDQTVDIAIADTARPLNSTHVLSSAAPNSFNQTVTLAPYVPFNTTQVLTSETNIPLNQTVDIAPSVAEVPDTIPAEIVTNDQQDDDEMPITRKSPTVLSNSAKSLISRNVLPSKRVSPDAKKRDSLPKVEENAKAKEPPVQVKQEITDVNTTFEEMPETEENSATALDKAEQQLDSQHAVDGAECNGRLSIRSDLFGHEDVAKLEPSPENVVASVFKFPFPPEAPSSMQLNISDDEFKSSGMILNSSDFDFLLSKGDSSGNSVKCRDSLLERFDPLSGPRASILPPPPPQIANAAKHFSIIEESDSLNDSSVVVNEAPIAQPAIADDQPVEAIVAPEIAKLDSNTSSLGHFDDDSLATSTSSSSETYATAPIELTNTIGKDTETLTMSVGLIQDMNNESMKSLDLVSCELNDKPSPKMNDNDKKVKHEHAEELEKKLKEAEAREEQLIRRITEKEKQMTKLSSALENYEKTMVELISEREQMSQNFEKQIAQLKTERDSNYHHLTSLENTFSDLHVKYEKSKQMAHEVKERESKLLEKVEFSQQQINAQELRYDKLKNHALTQLEGANAKLETLTRNHSLEMKKLTAQMKKEEISRQSLMEQLSQKTKENEELVKICDELINQGPDGS